MTAGRVPIRSAIAPPASIVAAEPTKNAVAMLPASADDSPNSAADEARARALDGVVRRDGDRDGADEEERPAARRGGHLPNSSDAGAGSRREGVAGIGASANGAPRGPSNDGILDVTTPEGEGSQ